MMIKGRYSHRGSALLAAMIVITILSFVSAGVLSYSLNTYRNSVRQQLLDQAREVADSEMEYLFFEWKQAILSKTVAIANISVLNPSTGVANNPASPLTTNGICMTDVTTPVNQTSPTPTPFDANYRNAGWLVARQVNFVPISGTSDGSAQGLEPGTQQIGHNYYFTAYTNAVVNNPIVGKVSFHSGRHFVYSSTSLFQFAVFYQGNLEIAAGGNMTIQGPISTNASAYMGSQTGYTLTIADTVYYFQDYNGASDPLSGETQRLQGTGALSDPVYNPNPQSTAPSDQTTQRGLQVVKLASQSSFIGGVDVASDIATYPTAYQNQYGVADPNEVYRSVIAPPPTDGSGNLIAEDPVVAANRMYNTAGIIVTLSQTGTGTPTPGTGGNVTIHVGNASDPTAYDSYFPASTLYNGSAPIITGIRQTAQDQREYLGGNATAGVNLTTVDIGNLTTVLTNPTTGLVNTNPTIAAAYNGVVYVYDKTKNDGTNGNTNTLNGIRINDAAATPDVRDVNGNPMGFTVVTDNGLYVQGDYNTNKITVSGTQINNPSALMGDAVTALSSAWTPSSSYNAIDGTPSRWAAPSTTQPANGAIPSIAPLVSNGMQINAAILTGNTPSTSSTNSGGVQNLVRMVEDWYTPGGSTGLELVLNGSLGQLFTSKYFQGAYLGNGIKSGLPNTNDRIYLQPKTRVFDYDSATFQKYSAAGSPTTTNFARGDFFFW
jgi:type II secretory pathway pseudopilin PulG